jgi:hypothetical protein
MAAFEDFTSMAGWLAAASSSSSSSSFCLDSATQDNSTSNTTINKIIKK